MQSIHNVVHSFEASKIQIIVTKQYIVSCTLSRHVSKIDDSQYLNLDVYDDFHTVYSQPIFMGLAALTTQVGRPNTSLSLHTI